MRDIMEAFFKLFRKAPPVFNGMNKKIKISLLILGIAGFCFAGYLSAVKFFSSKCAFGESCPYFLGYPACYYGLVMYSVILVSAVLLILGRIKDKKAINIIASVSFLGILFAGYFTLTELPILFTEGFSAYLLGLPTCALGLIFYVIIFIISLISRFKLPKDKTV